MKKVFVIFVALDGEHFEHYCTEPQTFYNSYNEAKKQMDVLITSKEFKATQVSIKKLWKIK